jgi:predicted dehydrogenase
MSVSVKYKKGAMLTYSLNLFNTDEGYNINIIGEKGRLEASTFFAGDDYKIIVRHRGGKVEEITFPKVTGTHDGGDDRMVAMLFGGLKDDPLGQCADSFDGIKSAMIGIAANKSIKEGKRIELTPILDKMR